MKPNCFLLPSAVAVFTLCWLNYWLLGRFPLELWASLLNFVSALYFLIIPSSSWEGSDHILPVFGLSLFFAAIAILTRAGDTWLTCFLCKFLV